MRNLKKGPTKFLDLKLSASKKRQLQKAFNKVILSGNFILNKEVRNFERKFADYLEIKYCIGVGNGLEALQISLMALGIGSGDEVITTPISAVATTLAILSVGGKPVFVDIKQDGLIDPDLILQAIGKKTKVILPVHLYGNPVQLDKIQYICRKNNLYLIEDAAQAHGSQFKGKKLGTFGNLGCFSFYPTKNLGALGDGGAIVTNSNRYAKICREIRDYGQREKYNHVRFGLNSRLDEIQASFLNVKLKTLDLQNKKRRALVKRYIKNLSKITDLQIIMPDNILDSNFHLFVIKVKKRNPLMRYLRKQGIQTLIHYPLIIPDQPFLKSEYQKIQIPKAKSFVREIVSLPLHPNMNLADIDYISRLIRSFYINY